MRLFAVILLFCLLVSCASNSEPKQSGNGLHRVLEATFCPSESDFQGIGIGASESEALAQARSNMALEHFSQKIESSIQIAGHNINEIATTIAKISIDQKAALINPQDAKLHYSARQGKEIGVVVCMSRSDAAKGFMERQRLIADSLGIVSGVVIGTEHPKRKNEAWHKTQMLIIESERIQSLLHSWSVAKTDLFDYANKTYGETKDYYADYCKNQKVYWADSESECSKAVFAELSKKVKVEKAKCLNGLNLNFSCSEKCRSSSFGVECSFEPFLAIESCNGESYSLLKAKEPLTGSDMHNENRAREDLIQNLHKAVFFKEWENEIKQWRPQCE